MLKSIESDVLIKNKIIFEDGLNVVLGENNGKNSIGKSSFLVVIDYAFGGESLKKYSEIIKNVGDFSLSIEFVFNDMSHYFVRSTSSDKIKYINDKRDISLDEYKRLLAYYYKFPTLITTYRSLVSIVTRIWNVGINLPNDPLKINQNIRYDTIVQNLLDLFCFSGGISDYYSKLKENEFNVKLIKDSYKYEFVKKVSKRDYKNNELKLYELKLENKHIEDTLNAQLLNSSNLINDVVLNLKKDKDKLSDELNYIDNKIYRIENNLSKTSYIKSKNFKSLVDLFPDINMSKIEEVESFHKGISTILKKELVIELEHLKENSIKFKTDINNVDINIANLIKFPNICQSIIYKLLDNTNIISSLSKENEYFDRSIKLNKEKKDLNKKLIDYKEEKLSIIQEKLNSMLLLYAVWYYSNRETSLILFSHKNYEYKHLNDTGTGSSYLDLIHLDIALIQTTFLPYLIHDSILFKNIEIEAIENVLKLYDDVKGKQIFISFDELDKYSDKAKAIILNNKVITLTEEKPLFKIDWS